MCPILHIHRCVSNNYNIKIVYILKSQQQEKSKIKLGLVDWSMVSPVGDPMFHREAVGAETSGSTGPSVSQMAPVFHALDGMLPPGARWWHHILLPIISHQENEKVRNHICLRKAAFPSNH